MWQWTDITGSKVWGIREWMLEPKQWSYVFNSALAHIVLKEAHLSGKNATPLKLTRCPGGLNRLIIIDN